MGNYSKLIAAVVGGALSWAAVKWGLPAEWATGEFAAAITTVVSSVLVWRFPANVPSE